MTLLRNLTSTALENSPAKVKFPPSLLPRLAGVLLVLGTNVCVAAAVAQSAPRDRLPTFNANTSFPARQRVTASMYERILPGMSLENVERIIGFPGTPRSSTSPYNFEQPYTWKNVDGSGIVVWLVNNRVSMIGKFGLLESPAPPLFSHALFTLIQPGMTEAEVEALFGFPGQFRPELFRADWGQAFQWQNASRSYITVYFKDGRVSQTFTDLLPPSDIGGVNTVAYAKAATLEIGMTQELAENLLGAVGIPYTTTTDLTDGQFLWRYEDGSLLLVRFDKNRQIIGIRPLR